MNLLNNKNSELSSDEIERYSRHLLLPEIGVSGQNKLKHASVLCIGCGGLGSPLLTYLAAAGVGTIGIVDSDSVEKSNLQRQIIHSNDWVGRAKTDSALSRMKEINPACHIQDFKTLLTNENALEIMSKFDIICDCTDNFESRYLINDAGAILGKPIIYGAILKFEGQVSVFNLTETSPTFRDLIPIPPPRELLPTCSEAGVIGVLPGLIGIIQATEVIKIIIGLGQPLDGRVLIVDALKMTFRELNLVRDKTRKPINHLINYKDFCSISTTNEGIKSPFISVEELKLLLDSNPLDILLIDVRSTFEFESISIPHAISIPLENIENGKDIKRIQKLSSNKKIYVHCQTGYRSEKAILVLKQYSIEAKNVSGGLEAWIKLKTN